MIGIIAMVYLCIGLAFAGIVFLLIWLTFKINHRSLKECFKKKTYADTAQNIQPQLMTQNINVAQTTIYGENNKNFAPARKEKMLDSWLFGFLLITIAEIVIDMIL